MRIIQRQRINDENSRRQQMNDCYSERKIYYLHTKPTIDLTDCAN